MTRSWDEWFTKIIASRHSFADSARLTAQALDAGVKASWLATAAKDAIAANPALRRELYASPAGVLYHARTGRLLRLEGELPYGTGPRDLQALVTRVPSGIVDAILAVATTQTAAFKALQHVCGPRGRPLR